jgi:transmembrane 9 superfamily protein 1
VTFPLTVFGAMKGRQAGNSKYDPPCKPNRVAREIPAIPLYRTGGVQVAMAGLLPFSAIYIELHYLFAAVWGHHVFTVCT